MAQAGDAEGLQLAVNGDVAVEGAPEAALPHALAERGAVDRGPVLRLVAESLLRCTHRHQVAVVGTEEAHEHEAVPGDGGERERENAMVVIVVGGGGVGDGSCW